MDLLTDRSFSAQIVDLASFLETNRRRRGTGSSDQQESATLLSMRQQLRYQAVIGVDNLDTLKSQYNESVVSLALRSVRELLNCEFGQLRVYRYRQSFTTGHHCLEELIAGLLRIQYHARHIEVSTVADCDETRVVIDVSLSWGIGDSVAEAGKKRLSRKSLER